MSCAELVPSEPTPDPNVSDPVRYNVTLRLSTERPGGTRLAPAPPQVVLEPVTVGDTFTLQDDGSTWRVAEVDDGEDPPRLILERP